MNQDPKFKVEICANSAESALKAQEGGAYRIELCAGIPEGGTTPSAGEIRMARALLKETKMHVITANTINCQYISHFRIAPIIPPIAPAANQIDTNCAVCSSKTIARAITITQITIIVI